MRFMTIINYFTLEYVDNSGIPQSFNFSNRIHVDWWIDKNCLQ